MEPTGSLAELVFASNANDWQNKERVEQSRPFQEYTKGISRTLGILKLVGKSNDIDLLIRTEVLLVELEKTVHLEKDQSVMSSLTAAKVDLATMTKSLGVVQSSEHYQQAGHTHHPKKIVRGVPTDGFHEAVNSHIARIGNRMRTVGLSIPEKNILRQRQANMRAAREIYIGMQREALGLAPAKEKGLER